MSEKRTRSFFTLLLTAREVPALIDMRRALRLVREAFRLHGQGRTQMPEKVYLLLPEYRGDLRAMPAYVAPTKACGLKWVNVHPRNRRRGLPTVMGVILLTDPATGFPLAIMDGTYITKLRTGAAGGVAADVLARRDASTAALIGCGAQAQCQLDALLAVRRIRRVRAWSPVRGEAAAFIRRQRVRGVAFTASPTVRACVAQADVIVTITPSRRPLVQRAWVAPGTHINAIGADAPGKEELDPALLSAARVVVDDRNQAVHAGEINVPIARRQFRPSQIHATLGAILAGHRAGRSHPRQITLFDSTGLAIHDVTLARAVYQRAVRQHCGRRVRLID